MDEKERIAELEAFNIWRDRREQIRRRIKVLADAHRKNRGYFADVSEDFRYIIQEWHRVFEIMMDTCILKRYLASAHKREFITEDILSKIDFSKKIEIMDYINGECNTKINTQLLRRINLVRNAVVHNFHNNHYAFIYDKGHLINDEKIGVFLKDLTDLFHSMEKEQSKITLVEMTDRHSPF